MIKKHLHWYLMAGGITVVGAAFGLLPDAAEAIRGPLAGILAPASDMNLPLEVPPHDETALTKSNDEGTDASIWQTVTVQKGDNLSSLFSRYGLSSQELHKVTLAPLAKNNLRNLLPGETLELRIDQKQQSLTELKYAFDMGRTLHLQREDDSYNAQIIEPEIEHRTRQATGTIDGSLFASAQDAGLSDRTTMELASIFGWDVDFALDMREGDTFTVLYEEIYVNGEKYRDGHILAAEFVNQGQSYQAIRYTDPDGHTDYYTPDAHSKRKAFIRTPVEFSRVSSGFNMKRLHPILNTIRAHKGVDYAAPIGTPIKVAGNGKVTFRGVKGGYGNVVIVQHGNTYSTLYGHMSAFGRGIKTGSSVNQGQIIGYVGKSGLASGPHLHYEFRVNGIHRNPLTIALPNADPLPAKYRQAFNEHANQMLARIDQIKRTRVALANP
ncbi:MAG: peptidoglycan DD-metalloendopeptidase family protein [Gammaproteobacteria bacterium]|nr:peptidoglycan DD-metalloendopeptidase family protein [Gammaproteobacteria bacterium]